jgi:hypothetical protein
MEASDEIRESQEGYAGAERRLLRSHEFAGDTELAEVNL